MMRMKSVQGIKKKVGSLRAVGERPPALRGNSGAYLAISIGVLLVGNAAQAATYTWDAGGGANTNWSAAANWNPDVVPGLVAGDFFRLTAGITMAGTSTMDSAQSLKTMYIGDGNGTHSWTLTGGFALTMDSGNSSTTVIRQLATSAGDTISVGSVVLNSGLRFENLSNNTLTVTSAISSSGGLKEIENDSTSVGNLSITGVISNGGGTVAIVQESAASAMILTGTNTFTGSTTISEGTLSAAAVSALGGTTSVVVDNGGTLLLGGAGNIDRVNNAAAVALAGGTLSMQGLSGATETTGTLTLSANSTIDFGTGNTNTLTFASLSLGSFSLAVRNWTGTFYTADETVDHGPASQDRLLFVNSPSLSEAQLGQISFFNDAGAFIGTAKEVSFGGFPELVPIPEPGSIFGGLALLGMIGYRERRRLQALLPAQFPARH